MRLGSRVCPDGRITRPESMRVSPVTTRARLVDSEWREPSSTGVAMGIVTWIIFGAVVGWLGFRLAGEPQQGCLTNIVIGIGGAMLGGAVLTIASGTDLLFTTGPAELLMSVVASVLGAAVLVLALRALGRRT